MIQSWSDARKLIRQSTTKARALTNPNSSAAADEIHSDPEDNNSSPPNRNPKLARYNTLSALHSTNSNRPRRISDPLSINGAGRPKKYPFKHAETVRPAYGAIDGLSSIAVEPAAPKEKEKAPILAAINDSPTHSTPDISAIDANKSQISFSETSPLIFNGSESSPQSGQNGLNLDEDAESEASEADTWLKPSWLPTDLAVIYLILRSNLFLCSFLVFVPLGIVAANFSWSPTYIFSFNFLAIIPLAWLLGAATEEIAAHTNATLGGLLNASFGNAVELIVSVIALQKGYIKLVQTSLLGSILSNMLLVLGMSFFLGGLRFRLQNFNKKGAQIFSCMLLLACLAISIPSAYVASFSPSPSLDSVLDISRITGAVVFLVYLCYLVFQLYTHQDVFESESMEEEEESSEMSLYSAIALLSAVTLCVAICSEYLVDAIEPITRRWGINEAFVGIILLPIVGNAAEHATAVTVAMKNKLDLSLGVAIGSSTQIALFLIPFITILGWIIDQPMSLNFTMFETVVLVLSVVTVNFIINEGTANWLIGLMLITGYFIIAVAYFFHPKDPQNQGDV
jgi:Ca2+:H+ antiporter